MAGEETRMTMTTEEAIKELNALQVKHNKEIKKLQTAMETVQTQIATDIDETNNKMKEEFKNMNDRLTSEIQSINTQFNTGLTNTKKEMAEFMAEYLQKFRLEEKTTQDETTNNWATVVQEIQEIRRNIIDIKNSPMVDEHTQQLDNHQNGPSFSSLPKQTQPDHNIASPMINNDTLSIHTNSSLLGNNRMQTVFLPTTTNAPVFHGKPTERPWQFLIRIEEYTETVYMWGEDMLLRGISQFLKDTALEWYCQLRSCNYLPKTWTEFKQAFVKQFNSPIRIAQHKQEWKDCKQEKNETINEFIIRLRALWVEQFPNETEPDLIKHLFCKMRPDMLNIMGYPRGNSLQDILFEAQRVEEIIYQREKQNNTEKKNFTNSNYNDKYYKNNYNNDNHYTNNNHTNKQNLSMQENDNTTNKGARQRTQANRESQQPISCFNCGKPNHISRDCWYKKQTSNGNSQQTPSASKNE